MTKTLPFTQSQFVVTTGFGTLAITLVSAMYLLLDDDTSFRYYSVPMFVTVIGFGLLGYMLIITRNLPKHLRFKKD